MVKNQKVARNSQFCIPALHFGEVYWYFSRQMKIPGCLSECLRFTRLNPLQLNFCYRTAINYLFQGVAICINFLSQTYSPLFTRYRHGSPPTFRYSSGATLMYRSIFSSLWWVMKGLAVAPPGIIFIIGVSTWNHIIIANYATVYFLLQCLFILPAGKTKK